LKYWSNNDVIITETLALLCDLSVGFSTARKLAKLEAVQFLLEANPVGGCCIIMLNIFYLGRVIAFLDKL